MITTIVDKNYLYKECKYLLQSIRKHMPEEKVYLFLVNCDHNVIEDVKKWNPNTTIDFRDFNVPQEQYISYMYVMMTFVFDWLLNEKQVNDDIIYLDADMVLMGSINQLYRALDQYDLIFRYHPFNRIKGPTTKEFGGIMNNGCVAIKNNTVMGKYATKLKQNIQTYLDTKKDPVIFVESAKVITCIDQEMLFTTYLSLQDEISFLALNHIYNDTKYSKEGLVWHAKGVLRTYPEYLIECAKYDKQVLTLTTQRIKLTYRKLIGYAKGYLKNPKESQQIIELEDILNTTHIKDVVVINSDFYNDNRSVLTHTHVICYDTEPEIYYRNKERLRADGIEHHYVMFDTDKIDAKKYALTIFEDKNSRIIKQYSDHLIIREPKATELENNEYYLSKPYLLRSINLPEIHKNILKNSHKYAKYIHPKWNNYIVDLEVQLFSSNMDKKSDNLKILEVGAGDGYCSYKLKELGYTNITATDIEPRYPSFYDVQKVSTERLPFRDNEFDIIISMNVLEHIHDIDYSLNEMKRVLKEGGIMLHSMPTPYLSVTTAFLLPLNYLRNVFLLANGYTVNKYKPLKSRNTLKFIRRIILSINPINIIYFNGHGVHGMFSSMYFWSYHSWDTIFKRNKLDIVKTKNMMFSLSLFKLFPYKFNRLRTFLGSTLPPVRLYIIIKKGHA